jgi:hypothetical protein
MDVFKLAFETIVVGLLTFVWLALAVDLLFPKFFTDAVPKVSDKYQSVIGVALLTLAYCFGSAIMPVAGQLINDEHWPLPEYAIRCWVTLREAWLLSQVDGSTNLLERYEHSRDYESRSHFSDCQCSYVDVFLKPDPSALPGEPKKALSIPLGWQEFQFRKQLVENDKLRRQKLLTMFGLYESKVLADLSDKNDSFRQLHERIIVLRGAVINGAILFLLCFFRAIARTDAEVFRWRAIDRVWIKTTFGVGIAAFLTLLALRNGFADLQNPDIFDIPVLEILFGLATIFGGYWVIRGVPYRSFLNKRTVFVSFVLTLLAYGGWIWSEVIYDQQIIFAVATAQKAAQP